MMRVLGKKRHECSRVPARMSFRAGGDLVDSVVHCTEFHLSLHRRATGRSFRVRRRDQLFERAPAVAVEGFETSAVLKTECDRTVLCRLLYLQPEALRGRFAASMPS